MYNYTTQELKKIIQIMKEQGTIFCGINTFTYDTTDRSIYYSDRHIYYNSEHGKIVLKATATALKEFLMTELNEYTHICACYYDKKSGYILPLSPRYNLPVLENKRKKTAKLNEQNYQTIMEACESDVSEVIKKYDIMLKDLGFNEQILYELWSEGIYND